jgi:predicted histidine transporter YuiF (NhaC family)
VFDSLETLALHRTIASFTEKKKKKKKRKKERKKKKKERKKKRKEKEGVASLCSGSLSCIIQMQWYSDLLGKE